MELEILAPPAPVDAALGAAEPPKGAGPATDAAAVAPPVPAPAYALSGAVFESAPFQGVPAAASAASAPAPTTVGIPAGVEPAGQPAARTAVPDAMAGGAVSAELPVLTPATQFPVSAAAVPGPAQGPGQAVPVPAGFAAQLARPVFTLASAGVGEHTMTVAVNPENLGPVTVQAHISAAGVRVELFAATSDGRDVLRQLLPELKRDLAGSGLNATLDLSSGEQPGSGQGSGQGSRDEFFDRRAAIAYPGTTDNRQSPMNSQASRVPPGLRGADGTLDVMA